MLQPGEVQEALERMRSGEASAEVLEVIVAGAEGFAALVHEYIFKSPVPGAVFATQNDMLAETMQAAKPNEQMLLRLAPPLPEWPNHVDGSIDD